MFKMLSYLRSHSTGSPAGGMGSGGAVDDLFQGKSPTSLHGKHRVFIIDTQVKYTVVSFKSWFFVDDCMSRVFTCLFKVKEGSMEPSMG